MNDKLGLSKLSSRYTIEDFKFEDRGSFHYTSFDTETQSPVHATVSKRTFEHGSKEAQLLMQRFDYLKMIKPPVREVQELNYTDQGHAFVITKKIDGKHIDEDIHVWDEAERRWLSCVRLVERLHSQGLSCGDLSHLSFVLQRSGAFSLVSILGTPSPAKDEPEDLLFYRAPEQWGTTSSPFSADVFSLGVLGYMLMAGRYPYVHKGASDPQFDLSTLKPVTKFAPECPEWLEEVVLQCLHPEPNNRAEDAVTLRSMIDNQRQTAIRGQQAPVRSGTSVSVVSKKLVRQKAGVPSILNSEFLSSQSVKIAASIAGVVVLVLIITFMVATRSSGPEISTQVPGTKAELLEVARAIDGEQVESIDGHRDSDDPLSHHLLVELVNDLPSPIMRRYAEEATLDRAWRKGLTRAVERVRNVASQVSRQDNLEAYLAAFKVLDPSLPSEERLKELAKLEAVVPEFAKELQLALALDIGELEQARPVLIASIENDPQFKDEDVTKRSTVALLFADPLASSVFQEDLTRLREDISDADLPWVLKHLAARNAPDTQAVANLAVERNVLEPTRAHFLKLIRDHGESMHSQQLAALVRAAAGAYTLEDVRSFGAAYNPHMAQVLLGILADTEDEELELEAFDLLAGKTFENQPSLSLMEWIKSHAWEQRKNLAKMVGYFNFIEDIPDDKFVLEFSNLDPVIEKRGLLGILIGSNSPKVIEHTLKRYASLMPLVQKLALLRHEKPEVRKTVINYIDTNEVGALRFIKDAFKAEENPEVRELYSKFWVVQ